MFAELTAFTCAQLTAFTCAQLTAFTCAQLTAFELSEVGVKGLDVENKLKIGKILKSNSALRMEKYWHRNAHRGHPSKTSGPMGGGVNKNRTITEG